MDNRISTILRFNVDFDATYSKSQVKARYVSTKFFSSDNGYMPKTVGRIIMLNVGETLTLDCGHQTVERVQ